jgi:predicted GNAT family acetyltransferase
MAGLLDPRFGDGRTLSSYTPTMRERATDYVRGLLFSDDREGQQQAERVMDVAEMPLGLLTDAYDATRAASEGRLGEAAMLGAMALVPGKAPRELSGITSPKIVKSEPRVADYIEPGSVMIRYNDPDTGSFMDIVTRPKGARSASVIGLEVPEEHRGRGIGMALQSAVMNDFPSMMGQVSSKAAAVNAYKAGRRPINNPNATLEDVFKAIDEDSSVNLATLLSGVQQ